MKNFCPGSSPSRWRRSRRFWVPFIKNVGTYTVTCKLGYEISAPLTVKIVEA